MQSTKSHNAMHTTRVFHGFQPAFAEVKCVAFQVNLFGFVNTCGVIKC